MNCSRCGEPLNALHIVDGCPKRPSDEVIEQATKVMHAEVCCPCDPQGCDWTHTREARGAYALADAGLLARPLPDREEVIHLLKWEFWPFLAHDPVNPARFWGYPADAVLDLLKGKDT